jgi:metal-dependent amidase/aminoacylase/carboxypeptidase family protein
MARNADVHRPADRRNWVGRRHGAVPQATIDPVMMAARFVVDVQSVVSREKDPTEFGVVSIGAIHGGTAANVIPDDVVLAGTICSFKPEVRAKMFAGIERTQRRRSPPCRMRRTRRSRSPRASRP